MKAYLCFGELGLVYLNAPPEEVECRRDVYFPELSSADLDIRAVSVSSWKSMALSFSEPGSGRKLRFTDAIGFTGIRGFETLVSERAVVALAPYIGAECAFLPVQVSGAPTSYFVLYVTRLLDCLDHERTRFSRPAPGLPTPISIPRLREDVVSGYLFRLAGGRGYQFNYDFATERFVELVRSLGLTGFRFRENAGSKSFGT